MSYTHFPGGVTSFGHPVGPNVLGLTGQAYFVAPSHSTTNYFYKWATRNIGGGKIFNTIAGAYNKCTTGRNDTVYVFPGLYTVTEELEWSKDNTHLVGLGGPQSRGGMGTGVIINTATATQATVVDMTGDNCQFINVQLRNAGAGAACLSALKVSTGVNFYAEGCHIVGHAAATQVDTASTCSLWLYTAAGGKPWGATFKNCKIGDAGELVRTDGSVILFSGGAAGTAKYVTFDNCVVEGWCETAAKPAVMFAENYCVDRYVLFKDTLFYNYYVNCAAKLTEVFTNACGTTFSCILMGSTCSSGYTAWNSSGGLDYIRACGPAAGAAMGTDVSAT